MALIVLFLIFYIGIALEISSISNKNVTLCNLVITNIVKILGGASSIFFIIIGYILERKIRGKIKDIYNIEVMIISNKKNYETSLQ